MAKTFPHARFIVVVRDVRSSIASQERMQDPSRVALTMSFARRWRKNIAFTTHSQQCKVFRDRLHLVTYEQIVRDPHRTTKELCEFLEVDYLPGMIYTRRLVGPQGIAWLPNSNFEDVRQSGIYPDSL